MKEIAKIFFETLNTLKEYKTTNTKIEDKSDMKIFENEEFLEKLKKLKKEVLILCEKFPVYK